MSLVIHGSRMRVHALIVLVLAGAASFAGCEARANPSQAGAPLEHPLDPLGAEEYAQAVELLRTAGHVNDHSRFVGLTLREPPKSAVLAWSAGEEFSRTAFAVIKEGSRAYEAVVDLSGHRVESWTELDGIQPSLLVEEFLGIGDVLAKNEEFVAALAARGVAMEDVLCAPMTVGNYEIPEHEGRRLLQAPCFLLGEGNNIWSRPIEGLWALVDLNTDEVVAIEDTGVIPIPEATGSYDEASVEEPRASLEPVYLHQPNGANFKVRGHVVEWDNWTLHQRMDKRSGLVVSQVTYRDGDRKRSILYRGALSEIFVPYMDPSVGWYSRTFLDAGEYGFGANATPLAAGYDCPTTGTLLDALLPDDMGRPALAENVICIFERNVGDPAWRHFDNFVSQTGEGRRAVELVVRTAAAVGYYDYLLDWVFTQDGRIVVRVGATGIDSYKGVTSRSMSDPAATAETAYGTLVGPNLVAPNHDHFFSFRLDVDVEGTRNSLSIDRLETVRFDGPRKSGWAVRSTIAATERDAMLDYDPSRPANWRIINSGVDGPFGHAPGYVIVPDNSVAYSLLADDDTPQQRAGFTDHQLWATPYDSEQLYAAGDYPNQGSGDGLPVWTNADRPIQDTDLVLWYTAGFHHVPRTEDFPIMPTVWHQFTLQPFNFFDGSPALDLPSSWRTVSTEDSP